MDNYRNSDLVLYLHPLASFCHKVLIALYENGAKFESKLVDLSDNDSRDELLSQWSVGKIPILRDRLHKKTIPETSIIIEYLDMNYPGKVKLIPDDPNLVLEVRLWDRFFDMYVSDPMQKIVLDQIRPDGKHDPYGVDQSITKLSIVYEMLEAQLNSKEFIAGEFFSMADCSAVPALFFADTILSFRNDYPKLTNYYERLLKRHSVMRTIEEAEPYFQFYPFYDKIPKKFIKKLSE